MKEKAKSDRKKKVKKDPEEPSRDSRGIDALAELTSSEVVQQLKIGMSRIAPIELEKDDHQGPDY